MTATDAPGYVLLLDARSSAPSSCVLPGWRRRLALHITSAAWRGTAGWRRRLAL